MESNCMQRKTTLLPPYTVGNSKHNPNTSLSVVLFHNDRQITAKEAVWSTEKIILFKPNGPMCYWAISSWFHTLFFFPVECK